MEAEARGGAHVSRRTFLSTVGAFAISTTGLSVLAACGGSGSQRPVASAAAGGRAATLYRQEGCSCCATYAEYLRENGFVVDMKTVEDLAPVRRRLEIPEAAIGCHSSVVKDYVVEGHVPFEAIDRLLSERPALDGIAVVGMPANSPGMGDPNGEPLEVLSFHRGRVTDYMSVTTF